MSQATTISYKELQMEAKRCGIPANMRRAFLESAIEAFVDNNHEKLNRIVQHHKNQRNKRRVIKSSKTLAKSTSTQQRNKLTKVVVTSPLHVQSSSETSRKCFYKTSGGAGNDDDDDYYVYTDDDSSDFRPDSTSTPNRCSSSVANPNHYPNDFSSHYARTNASRPSCRLSNHPKSLTAPTSATLPKIPAQQETLWNDKNADPSSIYVVPHRRVQVSSVTEQPLKPSQSIGYDQYDTNGANFNFARQNYFPVQTAGYYTETNADAQVIPVSSAAAAATYDRPPANPVPFEYSPSPSYAPRLVEKNERSSSSSSSPLYPHLPNSVSQLNGTGRKTSVPETPVSCSLNVGPTFVNNSRVFPVHSAVTSASSDTRTAQMTDIVCGANIADAASVNAEFDSDSDTETLSLTDEIVNLFDSRAENSVLSPSPAAAASSNLSFLAEPNSNGSAFNFQNRSVFGESDTNEMATAAARINTELQRCASYESERRYIQDIRVAEPVYRSSNEIAFGNVASATTGFNSLPSINTLLPQYKVQAYCESSQHCYNFAPLLGDYSQADWVSGTAALEKNNLHATSSSPYVRETSADWSAQSCKPLLSMEPSNVFGIPYLYANTSHSNDERYLYAPYSESHSQEMTCFATAEASIASKSSSMISSSISARLPVRANFTTPFDVFNEAVQEMGMAQCETNVVQRSAGSLLSKMSANSASNGTKTASSSLSEQQSASLFLKHETFAIQGTAIDNCAKEDVYCTKSLEIKMSIPVEKRIAVSTVSRSRKIQHFEDDSSIFSYGSCKNKSHGCDVVTTTEESSARAHEEECLYQVVHCPADECNWCGVLRTLTDHIYVDHKSDLNVGNDLVFVLDRNERDEPFATYFQLHKKTIIVITLHVNEKNCIATMQYLPEIESADYKNQSLKGTMQLVYFSGVKVETKCWKGVVRPYFENEKTVYQKDDILQSTIGNSKNVIIRVLID